MEKMPFGSFTHGQEKISIKGQGKTRATRRNWLRQIAIVTAAAVMPSAEGIAAASTPESKKTTKESVHYQDRPNAGKMCGMCKFFIPQGGVAGHGMMGGMMGPGMMADGTCQLVEGNINPMGYCILYTPA